MYSEIIVCDDVRQEASGKITIVGAYSGLMYLADFPAALMSITVFVRVISKAAFSDDISIKVSCEEWEIPLHELNIPKEKIDKAEAGDAIINCPMTLTNIVFNQPSNINVEVHCGSSLIRKFIFPVVKGPK